MVTMIMMTMIMMITTVMTDDDDDHVWYIIMIIMMTMIMMKMIMMMTTVMTDDYAFRLPSKLSFILFSRALIIQFAGIVNIKLVCLFALLLRPHLSPNPFSFLSSR